MRLTVLIGFMLLLTGCTETGKSLPKLYPVKGKVILKGGEPVPGGTLRLKNPDTSLSTVGNIQTDGTFEIKTLDKEDAILGAPAGEYEFDLIGPMGSDQQPMMFKNIKPAKIKVEEKENTVTIEVEKAKK